MIVGVPNPGVWGWPWHGLATGGVIPGSGKTITQPDHCYSWLIDIGLPAISLTSAESASATANDYEWRNYALIASGWVYNTELPNNSFIHVDAVGHCWLIMLSFTYPSANQVGIAASIRRFGLFGYGEQSSISKSAMASCSHIELTMALGNPVRDYADRYIALEDVWTNGSKALIGVWLMSGSSIDTGPADLFSVVQLTISGTGGTDGSGLSLSASEVIAQAALTYENVNAGEWVTDPSGSNVLYSGTNADFGWEYDPPYPEPCDSGTYRTITAVPTSGGFWVPVSSTGYGGGWDIMTGREIEYSYARTPYYNSAGTAKALRLVYLETLDHVSTGGTSTTISGSYYVECESTLIETDTGFSAYWDVTVEGEQKYGFYLYELGTLIDKLEWTQTMTGLQWGEFEMSKAEWDLTNSTAPPTVSGVGTTYTSNTPTWSGSLASELDVADNFFDDIGATSVFNGWRRRGYSGIGEQDISGTPTLKLGIKSIDAHAAGFYLRENSTGSARTYGDISTPTGVLSYTSTPTSTSLYFAWQRKTGDTAFSTSKICYV